MLTAGLPVGRCGHCGKQIFMTWKQMKENKPFTYCEGCRSRPELFGFTEGLDDLPASLMKAFKARNKEGTA